jgi:hypothetical protein
MRPLGVGKHLRLAKPLSEYPHIIDDVEVVVTKLLPEVINSSPFINRGTCRKQVLAPHNGLKWASSRPLENGVPCGYRSGEEGTEE